MKEIKIKIKNRRKIIERSFFEKIDKTDKLSYTDKKRKDTDI